MKPYLACVLLTLVSGSPSMAAKCDTDAVPAATLLVPYFEVEPANPNGKTTLFAVTNREAEPALAKVVLWTDWAIPTLGFEIYLAGYDVQTLNLRDILVHGRLPQTGSAVSPHGALSGPAVQFPGCNNSSTPGASPVYPVPALTEAQLAELRAFHMGECSGGVWASSDYGDNPDLPQLARGYLTVDLVNLCSALKPADPGYFVAGGQGVAGNRNALTGDYFLVDPSENFAQGETAVHVEAFTGGFAPGDYTFYKRFVAVSAADEREPLGTQYSIRHILGGAFDGGTQAIVWRDVGSGPTAPIACQTDPSWYEGPAAENLGMPGYRVYFDETGRAAPELDVCATTPPGSCFALYPTGLATQLNPYQGMNLNDQLDFSPPQGFEFGRTYFVMSRPNRPTGPPSEWQVLQGWVSVINSAEDRYSVGQRAVRLDSACAPAPVEPAPSDF